MCIDSISGGLYLAHTPIKQMELVTRHSRPVVLCVTIYTNLRMTLPFCTSHQICSHSLGALSPRWKAPQCIDCFPGLLWLVYAPTKYMEWVAIYTWHVILYVTIYTNLRMTWLFCSSRQFAPRVWLLWVMNGHDPSACVGTNIATDQIYIFVRPI